jgi:hypothetical protein
VGAVALALEAPHEGVGVSGLVHAVELHGVPFLLKGDLRDADGVRLKG